MIKLVQESSKSTNTVKINIPKELRGSSHLDLILKDFVSFYTKHKNEYNLDVNITGTTLNGNSSFIVEFTGDVSKETKQSIKNTFEDFISINFSNGYR